MGWREEKNGGGIRTLFGSGWNSVSCFPFEGGEGGGWRIGRFHQRAKGVAADFSERGEEGWNDYVCQGKFERKRATVVDGQEGGRVERGRESDVTKKKRDGRTNREKERHKERGRNERKKRYRLAVDEEIGIHG